VVPCPLPTASSTLMSDSARLRLPPSMRAHGSNDGEPPLHQSHPSACKAHPCPARLVKTCATLCASATRMHSSDSIAHSLAIFPAHDGGWPVRLAVLLEDRSRRE